LGVFWWQKRGEFVVECVVIVVFCVVISESLKTRQLFELYFLAFPFWESTLTRMHTPGRKRGAEKVFVQLKTFPQRLKPRSKLSNSGTAEAVPLSKTEFSAPSKAPVEDAIRDPRLKPWGT